MQGETLKNKWLKGYQNEGLETLVHKIKDCIRSNVLFMMRMPSARFFFASYKEKGLSMNSSSQRLRVAMFVVVSLAVILFIISIIFDRSYHTYRYLGNAMLVLLGIVSISWGVIDIRKARQTGYDIRWYQHPFVLFGIVIFIVVLVYLLNFFLL